MTYLKNNPLLKKIINQTNIFIFFLILNFSFICSINSKLSDFKPQNPPIINLPSYNQKETDNNIKKIRESFEKIQIDVEKIFTSFTEVSELNKKLNDKLEDYRKNLQNNYKNVYDDNQENFYKEFETITGIKNISKIEK